MAGFNKIRKKNQTGCIFALEANEYFSMSHSLTSSVTSSLNRWDTGFGFATKTESPTSPDVNSLLHERICLPHQANCPH